MLAQVIEGEDDDFDHSEGGNDTMKKMYLI